jgi:hypothetical protein
VRGCLPLVVGFVLGAAAVWLLWSASAPPPDGARPARGADIDILISNRALSRLLNDRVSGRGIVNLREIRITSDPAHNSLDAHAHAGVGPLAVPVTLAAAPSVHGGAVQVTLVSAHVGVIPVPAGFIGLLQGTIDDAVRRSVGRRIQIVGAAVRRRGLEVYANYR